jgi:hypothetical protein
MHTNDKTYCQNLVADMENVLEKASSDLDSWNKRLQDSQSQLATAELYVNFFKTQVKLGDLLKGNIPYELGAFDAPDTIKVLVNSKSPHAIADYFATVTHEYLHYASYFENKSFTASFFEEGLTEYFARSAIKNNLNTGTNLGYPVFTRIISEMTNMIPESELADIYFSKDETRLRSVLNRVYGDNFYNDNLITFETLQYTSDPTQILKLANTIMKNIGASPLRESDVISTSSNL